MKRTLAILLLVLLILCAAGCKQEQAVTTTQPQAVAPVPPLQVGYGRTDITPEMPMPLQGYPNPGGRVFNTVLDPIYATCIAFSDGTNTVLLFELDLTGSCWGQVFLAKQDISEATGIPLGNIMVSVTHTHSAPSFIQSPYLEQYTAFLRRQMLSAAQTALADQKESRMYTGQIEVEGLNFIRHYTMDDGSVIGDNFEETKGEFITGHVGTPDNILQVIRFTRDGGKDVVLANWQTHPHRTGGETKLDLSSDIVGPMTTYVESTMDCHFAYFSGASGNINPTSRISAENITKDYVEQGTELGRYAYLACSNMTPAATGNVQIVNHPYSGKSVSGTPLLPMHLNAISVGDVAFALVPYEMFSQNGEYVKENSPFQMTFMVTCANAANGYMPSEKSYAYNGTLSYEGTKCNYVKGTAEDLAETYVTILEDLHKTRNAGTASAQVQTAQLYWNADRGMKRTPEADGSYQASFICEGAQVTLRIPSAELMTWIDTQDILGLEVADGSVTDVIHISNMPQQLVCLDYCVQSIGGTKVKVNANEWLSGKEVMLDIKDARIIDVSEIATQKGATATLQKTDLVTAVADAEGNLTDVYISHRDGIFVPTTRWCDHCEADVEFLNWFSTKSLPVVSGHYYLENDITLASTMPLGSDVTLDLNGKTVSQSAEGELIYWMKSNARLTLIDSVGTGTMIPASTSEDKNHAHKKGLIVRMEAGADELNVYGGTYDASGRTSQHGCTFDNMDGTMNIYGGTFIGGTTYGAGGGTIVVQGVTNIYGGTFIGGHCTETEFETNHAKGGGALYVSADGTLNLYDAVIQDGISDYDGGCVFSNGKLNLYGGTISGGTAANRGDAIGLSAEGKLTVSGKVSVSGSIAIDKDTVLEVAEGCPVTVNRSEDDIITIH